VRFPHLRNAHLSLSHRQHSGTPANIGSHI
jgi:hypothetical protein